MGGNTSATIAASSTLDIFVLERVRDVDLDAACRTSRRARRKSIDVNGGVAAPGDVLEYRIVARNDGSDAALGVTLRDALPAGVTYVPGLAEDRRRPQHGRQDRRRRRRSGRLRRRDAHGRGAPRQPAPPPAPAASSRSARAASCASRSRSTPRRAARSRTRQSSPARGEQGAERGRDSDRQRRDGRRPGPDHDHRRRVRERRASARRPTPFCDIAKMPRKCVGCANSGQCKDPNVPDCDPNTSMCVCKSGPGTCVDTDDDGLSDGAEDDLGTDPNDADSDDDGVHRRRRARARRGHRRRRR